MRHRRCTVAVEGPCCAGKTSLARGLAHDLSGLAVAYVKDYSDHVGGGRFLPPPVPSSLAEEQRSLYHFLSIEAERTLHVRSPADQWDVVLIDRSIHTLLAHCYSLAHMTGVGYFGLARDAVNRSSIPLWPELVLYLDISQEAVNARNRGKFEDSSIFIDPDFNNGIRSYFLQLASLEQPHVVWLDATRDATMLRRMAGAQVRALLHQEDGAEGAEEGG